MRITSRPAEQYRDDPDALSLRPTPEDYDYQDAPEITGMPPSYSDSEAGTSPVAIRHVTPPLTGTHVRFDHNSGYSLSGGKPRVYETQDIINTRFDTDPECLEEGVRNFARDPPNPLVYIMGTHKETTRRGDKKETRDVMDFRIVLNMKSYVWGGWDEYHGDYIWPGDDAVPVRFTTARNGEKTYRGSFMKKRAPNFKQDIEVGTESPSLREWCHRYCASPSTLRIFRVRREVLGFDETFLKNRIEGLIRSTNYRGHINITFPVEDKNVDIYTSSRINQWRLKTWVCWIFYLTFLWIFTWPYLFFATKRYAVFKAEWLFSEVDGNGNKRYATLSEEEWFERWHVGIRRLVLDRFEGEASYEHLQGVIDRPTDPPIPGTISTGHAGVDNAVGILQQGFQVASAISRGGGIGRGPQGGWGYDN